MCSLTLQIVLLLERVLEKIRIRFIIWVGYISSVSYCYTSIIGLIRSRPFTRCRARAQVDHVLRQAGQLVPFRPGCASVRLCDWSCVGFRLTKFVLRDCVFTSAYCVRLFFFSASSFYNKVIIISTATLAADTLEDSVQAVCHYALCA